MANQIQQLSGTSITPRRRDDNDASVAAAIFEKQILVAQQIPRDLIEFEQATRSVALRPEIADQMFYQVPRGGKKIFGPSVRLVEVAWPQYKNLRSASYAVAIGDKTVTGGAICWDIQSNIAADETATRGIMTSPKKGKPTRYSDDMIVTTMAAAKAIAWRNAVIRVIGRSFFDSVYREAMAVVREAAGEPGEVFGRIAQAFAAYNVTADSLFAYLGIGGSKELTPDAIVTLRGLYNSIKEGAVRPEDVGAPSTEEAEEVEEAGEDDGPEAAEDDPFSQPIQGKTKPTTSSTANRAGRSTPDFGF